MSLGQISRTGAKVPIAGLNGLSGELVPSVSYYQSGSKTSDTTSWGTGETGTFSINLSENMPDTDYIVVPTLNVVGVSVIVHAKAVNSFKATVRNDRAETIAQAITLSWQAFKLMTDESRALDEAAIAQNAADIDAIEAVMPTKATFGKSLTAASIGLEPSTGYTVKEFLTAFNNAGYTEATFLWSYAECPYITDGTTTVQVGGTAVVSIPYASATRRDAIIMDCNTGHAQYFIGFTNSTNGVIRKILLNSDLTSTVTSGSTAPITSGGVYSYINTVNTGTATKESGIGGNITYRKCGRLVTVCIDNIRSTSGDMVAGQKLAADLPVPTLDTLFPVQCAYSGESRLFQITTGGLFYNHTYSSTLAEGAGVFGTVTYISAS